MASNDRITGDMILAMIAMGMGIFIIANDFSAMNVALPDIESAFDSDLTTVQWVINAYALVFAIFIVTGGRLADMFGRRRIFFIGATIFGIFSLLGGFAPNVYLLIAARAVMGIGGAMVWPAILGMTYAALPRDKAGLAGGLIIGAAGIAQGVGPLTGGFFTEYVSWRWVLYINLPVAALAMLITWRTIPRDTDIEKGERIDYAGVATLSVGLLALLYALDQATSLGWGDPQIIGALSLSAILLAAFVIIERRVGDRALVPNSVMSDRDFRSACIAIALIAPTFFVSLLYLPQIMQKFLDFSVIKSGLGLLPMMVPFAIVSFVAGGIYNRLGAKPTVSIGAAGMVLGPLLMAIIPDDANYGWLVPGMVLLGLGIGIFFSSVTTAAVTTLDESQTSLGGGIVYMFNLAGGSIGLALTTMVFSTFSQREVEDLTTQAGISLSDSEQQSLQGILVGTDTANEILDQFDTQTADQLLSIAKESFLTGFSAGMYLVTVLAFAGFLIVLLFVGGRLALRQPTGAVERIRDDVRRATHRAHG